MFDLPAPVAVVAHDAGAANVIFAWIRAGLVPGAQLYLEGPAAALWDGPAPCASLEIALAGAQAVITGTGWQSDLEHVARRLARQHRLRTVAVMDHWTFYEPRLTRGGETVLPDEIWITDEYAQAIAERAFPQVSVRRMPNLYLEAEVAGILACSPDEASKDLLYILEPARNAWGREIPGEFQGLDYFVDRLRALNLPAGAKLRLRLHPSEAKSKYDDWIARHQHLGFERDEGCRLSDSIARAGTVAGLNSFGLVVALAAGRRVISTLPPWAPLCYLPHHGLTHLKDLA